MKKELFLTFDAPETDVNFMKCAGEGSIEIVAAEDGDPKKVTFKIKAYNGGAMDVGGFFLPIVLDLAGMDVSSKNRPILLNHDTDRPIGHSTEVDIGAKSIKVNGVFSFDNADTQNIIASAKQGFPWQASVGARVERIARIDDGETATANGRTFKGPILIARKSTLKETSFVPLGADDTTSVKVAANSSAKQLEMEFHMKTFEEWLKANGHDISKISDEVKKALEATFKAQVKAQEKAELEAKEKEAEEGRKKIEAAASGNSDSNVIDFNKMKDDLKAEMGKAMLEAQEIGNICLKHPKILAEALANKWSVDQVKDKVELSELRSGRPNDSFNINSGSGSSATTEILAAAAMQAGGMGEEKIIKEYSQQTLEAADKAYRGRIGLQDLFVIAARANGYNGGMSFKSDPKGIFEAAMGKYVQGAFSTLSLPGILSNVANKFFVDAFNFVESTWRDISSIGRVTDFKLMRTYSLTADMTYKKLAPGGEIEHGTTGEEEYTNQADTYARMYSITRTDITNDDLGALTRVPAKLGRGAALSFNLVFWTEFLDNSTFFTVNNKNLTSGSAFGIDEVTAMETKFFDQEDPEGDPYGATPAIMLVPNALNVTASNIFSDTQIVIDGFSADTKLTNGNPHAGKFRVVRSSYLSNANIPGFSTAATYMLSSPAGGGLSVIESVFLNGQETPTIESADADFNVLGIQMRGFHDFGVNKQEFREGVKSVGS